MPLTRQQLATNYVAAMQLARMRERTRIGYRSRARSDCRSTVLSQPFRGKSAHRSPRL